MEKFYVPEIEEFYVGFEYELYLPGTNDKYLEQVVNFMQFKMLYNVYKANIQEGWIRVKYLDKEDIESLGFEYSENYADLPELGFLKDTNYLSPYTQYLLYYNPNNKKLRIERIVNCGTGLDDYLFNGIIKNKSELKKLLKQLCITK